MNIVDTIQLRIQALIKTIQIHINNFDRRLDFFLYNFQSMMASLLSCDLFRLPEFLKNRENFGTGLIDVLITFGA